MNEPDKEVSTLVAAWCQRRALRPLRYLLPHWPHNGLTDGIYELKTALENVRAFCCEEILPEEAQILDKVISHIEHALTNPK